MAKIEYKDLLDAGVHFGHMRKKWRHMRKKWNPKMRPYIFMERKGMHIIDLNRTMECMDKAANAMKSIAKSGKSIMYVATKKQARDVVSKCAQSVNMPYVTDRWLGGMMTNFSTIRRSIKKMNSIDKLLADGSATSMTKKEKLTLSRERAKLDKVLGGVANMTRLPAAIFIVDIHHEHIAIKEAHKLGIRTFAMVDTNSDPNQVDFPIPANDDASKSISMITEYVTEAIKEGLQERKAARAEKKS